MLYAASLQSEEIELQMKEYIPRIHSFVEEYIKGNPSEPKVSLNLFLNHHHIFMFLERKLER